jgi:hypothetical protein
MCQSPRQQRSSGSVSVQTRSIHPSATPAGRESPIAPRPIMPSLSSSSPCNLHPSGTQPKPHGPGPACCAAAEPPGSFPSQHHFLAAAPLRPEHHARAERFDEGEAGPALAVHKMTKTRAAPVRGRSDAPFRRPLVQAADLTSIFLACAGAGFGTVTLSTPLAMLALMSSALTPSGSSSVRSNEP